MTIFHLNPLNERLGICHDSSRSCPLSKANHFTSLEAATLALEHKQFSDELDDEDLEALIALEKKQNNYLENFDLAGIIQDFRGFDRRETKLLILLGKTLVINSSTEDKALVKEEKAKLLSQISDFRTIKPQLSLDEKQILSNLLTIKKTWLKNWK